MSTPVLDQPIVKVVPDFDQFTSALEFTMEDLVPYEEPTDKNAKAHIVNPPMNKHLDPKQQMTPQEIVDIARMTGQEVVALCGYRWVPKLNPDKLDICEKCNRIALQYIAEDGK